MDQYTCCSTKKSEMTGYHNTFFSKNVLAFFVQFFVLPLSLKHVSGSTFLLPKNRRNQERNPKKITISQQFSHPKKTTNHPAPLVLVGGFWCFPWVPPPLGGVPTHRWAFCCLIELHTLLLLLLPHKEVGGFGGVNIFTFKKIYIH